MICLYLLIQAKLTNKSNNDITDYIPTSCTWRLFSLLYPRSCIIFNNSILHRNKKDAKRKGSPVILGFEKQY